MSTRINLTDAEKKELDLYNVSPEDVRRCLKCQELQSRSFDECRFCDHTFPSQIPDEQLCSNCEQPMLWDNDSREWYCPVDHTQSVFDY